MWYHTTIYIIYSQHNGITTTVNISWDWQYLWLIVEVLFMLCALLSPSSILAHTWQINSRHVIIDRYCSLDAAVNLFMSGSAEFHVYESLSVVTDNYPCCHPGLILTIKSNMLKWSCRDWDLWDKTEWIISKGTTHWGLLKRRREL